VFSSFIFMRTGLEPRYDMNFTTIELNLGILEPYKDGFLEIVPEGLASDYWHIAAIHINGEVFCPTPQLCRTEQAALSKAQKIYDWVVTHALTTSSYRYYCQKFKIMLWRQPKL
jgi:hypothetical protein